MTLGNQTRMMLLKTVGTACVNYALSSPATRVGCDRDARRTIAGSRSTKKCDRYCIGRAKGDARASLAAQAAMQQIGLCLGTCGMLMTTQASSKLLGSEIKPAVWNSVNAAHRTRLLPNAYTTMLSTATRSK